jgi:dienelactone hydrolase
MERRDLRFPSAGGACAAWVYSPTGGARRVPCVVMANGASLTRHEGLAAYAERFAAAGAAVLAFDYRHFGDSPGEPRQRFRVSEQLRDWRSAVAFARAQEGIDGDRLALWGYSIAGGYVVHVAAADRRLAAVLATFPMLDGLARASATPVRDVPWTIRPAVADLLGRHTPVAATGRPGARAVMTLPGEAEGFARVVPPGSPWRNAMSAGVFFTGGTFRPVTRAARVTQPLWVSIGDRDVSAPRRAIARLVERAPRAELHRYPFDHFDALVGEGLDRVAADQVAFLCRTGLATR